ncbi:DUF3368 domain-containing protein [Aromatoleum anaerobium]|uniref:DUF3368 domain-containing protein n=1 Tax=Aromatoleum anaerobium TaxID=182180 RepID=A0ABX1PLM4_9RHOO|nr:DUF3368 domain-containing protein [Aromatoleum anaerobium]MCK0506045.1 DUF3368 domain-containing protein [Aromatoleum anaerobium]
MVVADSGPLIALARLELLRLLPSHFDEVLVPDEVFAECTIQPQRLGARAILAARESGLFECVAVTGTAQFAADHLLGRGEAAALILARDRACPALVDERKGRRVAQQLGIPVVGTVGILLAARQAGNVDALSPLFDALAAFGYRVPADLMREALRRAGEL